MEAAKAATPFAEMEAQAALADPPRNFFRAVTRRANAMQVAVIAEIIRIQPPPPPNSPDASSDAGDDRLPPSSGFDAVAIAQRYHAGGASALALVTRPDEGGTLADIDAIREAVPLPVLRSDIIIDPWQLWESRAAGADAVLLSAELLTEGQLVDMLILAQQLGLTTLLEVGSTDGLLRARPYVGFPHRAYALLGINNQGMAVENLDPNLAAAVQPPPEVAGTLRVLDLVDDPTVLVSIGGHNSRADVQRLACEKVRIVMEGPALLHKPDPGAAIRELNGFPVR